MRHDPAAAAIVIMLRSLKMYGMAKGTISQAGRSGGRLPRDIGTQDELKRANERPAGKTRVMKDDEKDVKSKQ